VALQRSGYNRNRILKTLLAAAVLCGGFYGNAWAQYSPGDYGYYFEQGSHLFNTGHVT